MTSTEPNLLIVGPGALGGLFAVRLGRRWPGVYLLDHRAERAARIQEGGFHVRGVTLADWTPPPGRVRADPKGWPVMDAAFFFIKAPGFAAALKRAAPVLGPKTALLVFPEAVDADALKTRARVIAALAGDRARVEGIGRIVHEASGATRLDASARGAKEAADLLREAMIPVTLVKEISEERWRTLLTEVCVDVPAALADAPQKSILKPPLKDLADQLLEECAALAKASGRPVRAAVLRERRAALVAQVPDAKSPLGWDLIRGRTTERAALVDPLLAAARKARVPAPLLTDMNRLLRRLEKEGPVS